DVREITDRGRLGGEVDRSRLDAVGLAEESLDPVDARGARHAGDGQVDLDGGSGGRFHTPPEYISAEWRSDGGARRSVDLAPELALRARLARDPLPEPDRLLGRPIEGRIVGLHRRLLGLQVDEPLGVALDRVSGRPQVLRQLALLLLSGIATIGHGSPSSGPTRSVSRRIGPTGPPGRRTTSLHARRRGPAVGQPTWGTAGGECAGAPTAPRRRRRPHVGRPSGT